MSAIFRMSSLLVLPFWALMIVLPRWRWTTRITRSPLISVAPALLYIALVTPRIEQIWPAVFRPTLNGIAFLLSSPAGATIAWTHFLAFDLFVGRWIYLDSQQRHISAWMMAPVLYLTLMLGPLGFALYLGIRSMAHSHSEREAFQTLQPDETKSQSFAANASLTNTMRNLISSALEIDRPLTIMAGAMLVLLLATIIGIFIDHRVITGAPAWLKPAKFAISVSIYCFTFVWLLGLVENHSRLKRLAARITLVSIAVEMVVIVTQAARGTTSHFNMTSPLNSVLWTVMGLFITFVWMMNFLLAVMLIRQRIPDRAFAWSLRLGVIISSVGMAVAFLMVRPTPAQIAAIANHAPHIIGAHSVGVSDGGPGLPVVGWSTVGGDLRVAHFVGLHALQVSPFLGWLLTRRSNAAAFLRESDRLTLVWTGGLTYLGFVLLLTWQALRGQSLIHPDAKTITAAITLVGAAASSCLITVARALSASGRSRALISQGAD